MKCIHNIMIILSAGLLALGPIMNIITTGGSVSDYGRLGFICVTTLLVIIKNKIQE